MNKTMAKLIMLALVLIAAALVGIGWELARDNQTHQALCVMKHDDEVAVAQSKAFIRMTPAQRAKQYGEWAANIPNPVLEAALRSHEADVRSLRDLHC